MIYIPLRDKKGQINSHTHHLCLNLNRLPSRDVIKHNNAARESTCRKKCAFTMCLRRECARYWLHWIAFLLLHPEETQGEDSGITLQKAINLASYPPQAILKLINTLMRLLELGDELMARFSLSFFSFPPFSLFFLSCRMVGKTTWGGTGMALWSIRHVQDIEGHWWVWRT